VALSDVNGDGINDIAIGSWNYREYDADLGRWIIYGAVFVEFGEAGMSGSFDYKTGDPDLFVRGADNADRAGRVVGGGDVDGDGIGDLLVGAQGGDGPVAGFADRGELYIVSGEPDMPSGRFIDLKLDGVPYIYGAAKEDGFPSSVATADLDGDGIDDILVGVSEASAPGSRPFSGETYVVLGQDPWPTSAINDEFFYAVRVYGRRGGDALGTSVALGDLDGDASGELIIGATLSDGPWDSPPPDREFMGEVIVLAWKDVKPSPLPPMGMGSIVDLETTPVATSVVGADSNDNLGSALAVGDINDDGLLDIVAGANGGDGDPDGAERFETGEVWVISPGDVDGDDVLNLADNCPNQPNAGQEDRDGDGVGDECDNCPDTVNPNQEDRNGNGTGDACEGDSDGDGIPADGSNPPCAGGDRTGCDDNCPQTANADQSDVDGDAIGDVCDDDNDNDGFLDFEDNCPDVSNADQYDADNDGTGNACETLEHALTSSDATVWGQRSTDGFGRAGTTGDFDADGTLDLLIGAPYANEPSSRTDAGIAYVFYGPIDADVDLATTRADVEIYGQDAGDQLGWSVAVGDLNSDGIDDIVVGAPGGDGSANDRADTGQVHVFYGGSLSSQIDLATTSSSLVFFGDDPGDRAGEAVAVVDASGDGLDDLVIASPTSTGSFGSRPGSGEVWVTYNEHLATHTRLQPDPLLANPTDNVIVGADIDDHLGSRLAVADMDDDGTEDLVISAVDADGAANSINNAGEVFLLTAADFASRQDLDLFYASDYTFVLHGDGEDDFAGSSLAVADVDGDGLDDLLVGAPGQGAPPGGAARVGAGGAYRVDGRADLASLEGLTFTEGADKAFYGAAAGLETGAAVAMGDYTGDGVADYLLAGPSHSGGGVDAGAVFVVDGNRIENTKTVDLALLPALQVVEGLSAGDRLGDAHWLAIGQLGSSDGLELICPTNLGDGPSGSRTDAGEFTLSVNVDRDSDGVADADDCAPDDASAGTLLDTGDTSTFGTDTWTFSWSSVPGADTYSMYRGTITQPWQWNWTCIRSGLTTPEGEDKGEPDSGHAFYYESRAFDGTCGGRMGTASDGDQRPEPPACP
jgi:hypothetical protein